MVSWSCDLPNAELMGAPISLHLSSQSLRFEIEMTFFPWTVDITFDNRIWFNQITYNTILLNVISTSQVLSFSYNVILPFIFMLSPLNFGILTGIITRTQSSDLTLVLIVFHEKKYTAHKVLMLLLPIRFYQC